MFSPQISSHNPAMTGYNWPLFSNRHWSTLVFCGQHRQQGSPVLCTKICFPVCNILLLNKMNISTDNFDPPAGDVERIKNEFNAGLDKLTFNCRNTIHGLTKYAESRIAYAATIADELEKRIRKVGSLSFYCVVECLKQAALFIFAGFDGQKCWKCLHSVVFKKPQTALFGKLHAAPGRCD